MLKAVLFEPVDVIYSEDYLNLKFYEILLQYLRKQDPTWNFPRLMKQREEVLEKGRVGQPYLAVAEALLTSRHLQKYRSHIAYFRKRYENRYVFAIPGMGDVIKSLRRHFELLVVSNQEGSRKHLRRMNLHLYFKEVLTPARAKSAKPSLEIYRDALRRCKALPEQALMIGSRVDFDILPARALGMYTILTNFPPSAKGILPQNSNERAYFQSVMNYPEWPKKPRRRGELPHAVARSPAQIVDLVKKWELPAEMEEQEEMRSLPAEEEEAPVTLGDILKEILRPFQLPPIGG